MELNHSLTNKFLNKISTDFFLNNLSSLDNVDYTRIEIINYDREVYGEKDFRTLTELAYKFIKELKINYNDCSNEISKNLFQIRDKKEKASYIEDLKITFEERFNILKEQCLNANHNKIGNYEEDEETKKELEDDWLRKVFLEFIFWELSAKHLRDVVYNYTNIFQLTYCSLAISALKNRLRQINPRDINTTSHISKEPYINESRIEELNNLKNSNFDLSKLIQLCKEVNSSSALNNFFAVGSLIRAIVDHIPPIFSFKSFEEVANNYKSQNDVKSFKASMLHLNNSMKHIGHSILHSQIREKESLPNDTQIDCKRDLDRLLAEIIRILK